MTKNSASSTITVGCGDPAIWAEQMDTVGREITRSGAPELAEFTVNLINQVRRPLELQLAWPSGLPADQRRTIEAQVATALEGALVRYHVMVAPLLIDAVGKIGQQICVHLRKMGRAREALHS